MVRDRARIVILVDRLPAVVGSTKFMLLYLVFVCVSLLDRALVLEQHILIARALCFNIHTKWGTKGFD